MLKYTTLLGGALLMVLAIGCDNQQAPLSPETSISPLDGGLPTLSQGSGVVSCWLNIHVSFANDQPVNLHAILDDWDPSSVTWNSFSAPVDPNNDGSFTADSVGWHQIDVTDLVNDWLSGAQDNFGVILKQPTSALAPALVLSTEQATFAPFLELSLTTVSGATSDTLSPEADVYIDEGQPDMATEGSSALLVGQLLSPGMEKQILIRFNLSGIVVEPVYSAIGSRVWEDVDLNGLYSDGEPGIPGVTVHLYNCEDSQLASTSTDAAGLYRFDSLSPGSFVVEYVAPAGYLFSPVDQDPADTLDSDADPQTGRTDCFALGEGEEALSWDAGLYLPAPTDSGCTRSKGYWKNHAGGGHRADAVTALLPIWLGDAGGSHSLLVDSAAVAVDVLGQKTYGHPSNGITKLLAQLLAAKLNIASGALDDEIADDVADADAFLAAHAWTDWENLDKDLRKSVLQWKDVFDMYNNGRIGPGSCDAASNK